MSGSFWFNVRSAIRIEIDLVLSTDKRSIVIFLAATEDAWLKLHKEVLSAVVAQNKRLIAIIKKQKESARQYLEQTNSSQEEILKFIYDEYKALEKNWKVLAWKFTQLNSAMGDALSQLKTTDTPNSAALRTDKVENLIVAATFNPQTDDSSQLSHKGSAGLMHEMMSPTSNGALEVIESNKSAKVSAGSAMQYLEQTNSSQEENLKFIYDEYKALEKNWKVLAWKFTQLNSAMGDALSQLKTTDTPNSAALRTDKVENLIVAATFNPQTDDSSQLSHEMMSPTSNGALEVIESNKSAKVSAG
ncbi:hypothetical protein DY000_02035835 [Brassica cretica]|uniref:Uncharacterized protein n=1 Tax=Brassica cretica TaxID=69181 RepID=A0ABQ7DMX1_BRACR|nr:hypothetical protein DY000_02035835 [Brassica cretica]